jgi:hypothetical protein
MPSSHVVVHHGTLLFHMQRRAGMLCPHTHFGAPWQKGWLHFHLAQEEEYHNIVKADGLDELVHHGYCDT